MHAIFQKAAVKNTDKSSAELKKRLLTEFTHAVASRPFDLSNVQEAAKQIKDTIGYGALIEASSGLGGMEMATRVVDATGKRMPGSAFNAIASCVFVIVRTITVWFGHF
mmetsp:Transcript_44101/g.65411  ORF Transcript_44101/g.65411 Transcript_44101/m.65411 type:complete len:109 (-) Transcript_44101:223-549(-)